MDELTQAGSDEIDDKSEDLAFYMAKMNNLEVKHIEGRRKLEETNRKNKEQKEVMAMREMMQRDILEVLMRLKCEAQELECCNQELQQHLDHISDTEKAIDT